MARAEKPIRERQTSEEQPEIDEALVHLLERKTYALERYIEMNRPLEEAVQAELAATDEGRELLLSYEELASNLAAHWTPVQEGLLSPAAAWRKVAPALADLKARMRPSLEAAYSRHADLIPSHRTTIETLYGENAFQTNWVAEIMWLPILSLVSAPAPADAGVIQQGLDEPPPFNLCQMAPYASKETRFWRQLAGTSHESSYPSNGSFFCFGYSLFKGGGSSRALIINDFTIPAGHSICEVSADIDWSYQGWTFAVFGAAGVGADLLLQVDRGDGSPRQEIVRSLFSLLSPVAWGNSSSGDGSSKISTTFSVNISQAQTIRVYAGATCHAETNAFVAEASVSARGTVKNICIKAI